MISRNNNTSSAITPYLEKLWKTLEKESMSSSFQAGMDVMEQKLKSPSQIFTVKLSSTKTWSQSNFQRHQSPLINPCTLDLAY
uniref:Uncharacterized protein n=1 Tax=Trichogramma kaykai TaxID=54128 RepID=A0ABD2W9I8_9HYME